MTLQEIGLLQSKVEGLIHNFSAVNMFLALGSLIVLQESEHKFIIKYTSCQMTTDNNMFAKVLLLENEFEF